MKRLVLFVIILILLVDNIAFANEDFDKAVELIQNKVTCDKLTNEQLEIIGDYFMEQMHPGKLHEIMDERMGGEGSENLKLVHINMAKMFYCGQSNVIPMSMMSVMMNRGGFNMMGYNNLFYGMGWFGMLFMILFWIGIIWLIVWIIQQITKNKESSLDIVEKRFAHGEINKKQYLEMKKTLRR